jgi:chitin deacetylase
MLKKENVKATFFVIGVEAKRHYAQLKKIVASGQEVGNHSYSHKNMSFMMPSEVAREIEDNDTLIRSAGYAGPIQFRVPYNVKFVTLPFYLMQHGRPDISRDVITNEGYQFSSRQIADTIVRQVRPGSIILLHPMYKHTASSRSAIPIIIDSLRAKGYSFVTVSQLLTYQKS